MLPLFASIEQQTQVSTLHTREWCTENQGNCVTFFGLCTQKQDFTLHTREFCTQNQGNCVTFFGLRTQNLVSTLHTREFCSGKQEKRQPNRVTKLPKAEKRNEVAEFCTQNQDA